MALCFFTDNTLFHMSVHNLLQLTGKQEKNDGRRPAHEHEQHEKVEKTLEPVTHKTARSPLIGKKAAKQSRNLICPGGTENHTSHQT